MTKIAIMGHFKLKMVVLIRYMMPICDDAQNIPPYPWIFLSDSYNVLLCREMIYGMAFKAIFRFPKVQVSEKYQTE